MWAAAMFGRCFKIQSGKIDSAWAIENRPRSNVPSACNPRPIEPANSPMSIGVIPVPMQMPNRSGSIRSGLMPESSTARAAAPTANPTARLISFALLRCSPRKGSTSKFFTSPAILTAWPEVSKLSIGPTPERPSTIASLKDFRPTPFGETTPIPVMTTRRISSSPAYAASLATLAANPARYVVPSHIRPPNSL